MPFCVCACSQVQAQQRRDCSSFKASWTDSVRLCPTKSCFCSPALGAKVCTRASPSFHRGARVLRQDLSQVGWSQAILLRLDWTSALPVPY